MKHLAAVLLALCLLASLAGCGGEPASSQPPSLPESSAGVSPESQEELPAFLVDGVEFYPLLLSEELLSLPSC